MEHPSSREKQLAAKKTLSAESSVSNQDFGLRLQLFALLEGLLDSFFLTEDSTTVYSLEQALGFHSTQIMADSGSGNGKFLAQFQNCHFFVFSKPF